MKKTTTILLATLVTMSAYAEDLKPVDRIPKDVKSVKAVIPIYSQRLAFRLPTDWKPAFQDQKSNMFMIEFTPKNETIQSWSNMFSVQGFKNLASKANSEQFLDNLASRFQATCGEYLVYEKIGSPIIDGFKSTTAILGCSKLPDSHPTGVKKGQSEIGYYYSIQGKKDIYLIHKSVRGDAFDPTSTPLTRENIASFIAPFNSIELCKNTGGQGQCNK
ncbi:hypothetical protein [Kistimonas asteriae]|uniref:hypothetical protein n=1 Tax=Kistimonas asteriae TaxID=517724 RepID=UPI001BA8BBE6|nr:hypothetical protein [Kistimonas asteriae]